jgi:hypothetical protein
MTMDGTTAVILATSLAGAFAEALVTYRWYEPPPRDDGETPEPVYESVLFFVGFALLFGVLGYAITVVSGVAQPFGLAATLLLVPLGGVVAYASHTGRMGDAADTAQQYTSAVFGLVLGAYPLLLLVA